MKAQPSTESWQMLKTPQDADKFPEQYLIPELPVPEVQEEAKQLDPRKQKDSKINHG